MKHKLVSFCNELLLNRRNLFMAAALTFLPLFSFAQDAKEPAQSISSSETYIKPDMIFVPGGRFKMGSGIGGEPEEMPEHFVNLSDFRIGKYEVTVGEFRKFMNSHTYVTDAEKDGFSWAFDGRSLIVQKYGVNWECDVLGNKRQNEDNHPVLHVSWNDAVAYCNWLSKQSGKAYRLPTEAEWEYAAKGGPRHDSFIYSGGNDMDRAGWYAGNSGMATHPVGQKAANGLGVYDMSGNAWEWCADLYSPYSVKEQTNPTGAATGTDRMLRGGGWRYLPTRTRNAARRPCLQGFNGSGIGFRLASSGK